MSTVAKIIITDDHKMIRKAWKLLLESELQVKVVGEAENGHHAILLLEKEMVDIILMDIDMPGMDGLEATRTIKNRFPWTKVIALTMHKESAYVDKMLLFGASGYLTKNSSSDELVLAVQTVLKGGRYICQEASYLPATRQLNIDSSKHLTTREIEIIKLISGGLKTKEIAEKLFLSIKTVEAHRSNIFKKMDVKNVAELLSKAREKALIY